MSLKEDEKRLLLRIKELGLYRTVKHTFYDEVMVLPNSKLREIDASTHVKLYRDKDNDFVAMGHAHKSILDKNFHKQLGRVIATGRALKQYEEAHKDD